MKVLSFYLGLIILLFAFNAVSCPLCWLTGKSHDEAKHVEEKKESNVSQCKLKVEGMTCGACVKAVEKALKNLDGVSDVSVKLGEASVNYDNNKVKQDAFVKAIENAGFKAFIQEEK